MKDLDSAQKEFTELRKSRRDKFLTLFDATAVKLQEVYG